LLKMLARSIPVEALLALSARCGGRRVYVPKTPNTRSRFAAVLDPKSFAALTRICGGEVIDFPTAAAARRCVRDRAIVTALASGESKSAVAARFKMSRRRVYGIASEQAARTKPPGERTGR